MPFLSGETVAGFPAEATLFLLLFARTGAILMLLPAFSDDSVPMRIRLVIAMAVAVGLIAVLGPSLRAALPGTAAGLPALVIAEMLVGLALGAIIRFLFLAAAMAGSLVTMQTGLFSAIMPDPSQGGQAPILSRAMSMGAIVLCLSLGLHHQWIAAMIHSYAVFPVGALPPAEDFAMLAIETLGHSTALALSLAGPLMVYGLVYNVALGITSRIAPAIQVFFIFQPLQLMLGLGLTALTFGTMLSIFADEMAATLQAGWF